MPEWLVRLKELLGARQLDRQLDEEVRCHLEMLEAQFRARGMSPEDACLAARREFGGVEQTKEAYRDGRGVPWLENFGRDLRYALRGLRKSPGFTATAVLSLALGIGANATVFSLFRDLMLRMLPVQRPSELVYLQRTGGWGESVISYPLYLELNKRRDLFQGVVAATGPDKVRFASRAGGKEEFAQMEFVSGNYFSVLGVEPAVGRLFTDDDNRTPGAHPLAILSDDFWRNRFGADPSVVGRTVMVDEQPRTIIGVAAPGFHGERVERHTEIWEPAMMSGMQMTNPSFWWVYAIARRRPEISTRQLQAAVDVMVRQNLLSIYGAGHDAGFRGKALGQRLEVREGAAGISLLRDSFARPLAVLMVGVALVLLTSYLNVAGLLIARAAARRKEIAMRFALGATRPRLIAQSLAESLLLAAAGGALGLLLAVASKWSVLSFLPARYLGPFAALPDAGVLAFAFAVSLLSVVVFGLAPAWRSTAVSPAASLHPGSTESPVRSRARRVLVVAQVAFSVVLVASATLAGRSLLALRSVDLGFRNRNTLAFDLDFPRRAEGRVAAVREHLLTALERFPGVISVSSGFPGPFELQNTADSGIGLPGSSRRAGEPVLVNMQYIAPRYFETIGSPLEAGREFAAADRLDAPKVAVVNQAFVREFLDGDSHVLGRVLTLPGTGHGAGPPATIVGVVASIRHDGLRKNAAPTVYVPAAQLDPGWPPVILVRSSLPEGAMLGEVRAELGKLSSEIVVSEPRTIQRQVDESIFQDRLLATLAGFFGVMALLLAAIGLYGVMSFGVARRTSEIGIRMALGARNAEVMGMVLREALALVAVGLLIGLPAALAVARMIGSLMFGVSPTDPLAFAATAALLIAAGLAAAFLPSRRAASIDPIRALRHE